MRSNVSIPEYQLDNSVKCLEAEKQRYLAETLLLLYPEYLESIAPRNALVIDVLSDYVGRSDDLCCYSGKQIKWNGIIFGSGSNSGFSDDNEGELTEIRSILPEEWRFGYFVRLVTQNRIDTDRFPRFRKHVQSNIDKSSETYQRLLKQNCEGNSDGADASTQPDTIVLPKIPFLLDAIKETLKPAYEDDVERKLVINYLVDHALYRFIAIDKEKLKKHIQAKEGEPEFERCLGIVIKRGEDDWNESYNECSDDNTEEKEGRNTISSKSNKRTRSVCSNRTGPKHSDTNPAKATTNSRNKKTRTRSCEPPSTRAECSIELQCHSVTEDSGLLHARVAQEPVNLGAAIHRDFVHPGTSNQSIVDPETKCGRPQEDLILHDGKTLNYDSKDQKRSSLLTEAIQESGERNAWYRGFENESSIFHDNRNESWRQTNGEQERKTEQYTGASAGQNKTSHDTYYSICTEEQLTNRSDDIYQSKTSDHFKTAQDDTFILSGREQAGERPHARGVERSALVREQGRADAGARDYSGEHPSRGHRIACHGNGQHMNVEENKNRRTHDCGFASALARDRAAAYKERYETEKEIKDDDSLHVGDRAKANTHCDVDLANGRTFLSGDAVQEASVETHDSSLTWNDFSDPFGQLPEIDVDLLEYMSTLS